MKSISVKMVLKRLKTAENGPERAKICPIWAEGLPNVLIYLLLFPRIVLQHRASFYSTREIG